MVCLHDCSVCDDNFVVDDVVDGHSFAIGEERKTSTKGKTQTNVCIPADNGHQVVWIKGIIDCAKAIAGSNANVLLFMVNFDCIEVVCSDKDAAINICGAWNRAMSTTSGSPLTVEAGEKLNASSDLVR